MLLTLATTHRPATDLGYLLAKDPAHAHAFPLPAGRATVFFPVADDDRCEAALLVELDPPRAGRGDLGAPLGRFVHDRPYAASGLLSLAVLQVLGSALAGRSRERPELARAAIPLEATIVALRCLGGEAAVRRLFEPLGWAVDLAPVRGADGAPLPVPAFDVTLRGRGVLADLLAQIAVLMPALDDQTHAWLGADDAEALLAHGGAWLAAHPDRALIAERWRPPRRDPDHDVLARLTAGAAPAAEDLPEAAGRAARREAALSLGAHRAETVLRWLREREARAVGVLGCVDGRLLQRLAREPGLRRVVGVDVSSSVLRAAGRQVDPDAVGEKAAAKVELLFGSPLYADERWAGLDALVLPESIADLDPDRLPALEDVVFACARPRTVLVTTPNAETEARRPGLDGDLSPSDRRPAWTRTGLRTWAEGVAARRGYAVRFEEVGPVDDETGAPTQLAAFLR